MMQKKDCMFNIQTTMGLQQIGNNDRILVHEHIFNRYPFRQQEKMEEYVLNELNKAYSQGITIICDLTAYTKPYNYYKIIENSPIKIVSCVGFYTNRYIPAHQKRQNVDEITRSYSRVIEKGLGTKQVKPGILKIAAQSYNLSPLEEKLFSVIAFLSSEYGLPIALHAPKGAYNHVLRLISAGVKPERIFVAHIESGIVAEEEYEKRLDEATQILSLGAYIQLSDFGCTMTSKKYIAGMGFFKELVKKGYLGNLLLSADSCWRWKNSTFVVKEYNYGNGKPYTYTKGFILPALQQEFSTLDLEQVLLCNNPKHFFAK